MPRAHRRIVGEYPFTLLAADGDVAAGGELDHVTYAAVGAQLGETRDVGARDEAAHPLRGVGVGGVRPRIPQAPKPDHLRPDQQQVAVEQTVRLLEKHPRAVAAAQVAHDEGVLLPRQFCVQRREEHVFGETDIAVQTADGRVGCLALEALHWLAQIVEQHQNNRRSGPRGPGTDATRSLEIDERRPACRTELDPRIHGRGAARAVRSGTGSREPAAAVRAERLRPAGPTAAEGAGDRFTLLAGDRRARDDARARQGRAPRRRLPPTPPPTAWRFLGGLSSGDFAHVFAAANAALRAGVVRPPAIRAAGHWREGSTGRGSYG